MLESDQEIIDLERDILAAQQQHHTLIEHWQTTQGVSNQLTSYKNLHVTCKDGIQYAIPPEDSIKREILNIYHNAYAAGHLGKDQTYKSIARWYWWLGMCEWIAQYVKGCAACQQNKVLTHHPKALLYWINVPPEAQPFQVITMDLITHLPKCNDFDTILTI